jgi:hypothetical protein
MSSSKYKVEYETKDGWIISSTHRNLQYAEIQKELLTKKHKKVRITYRGNEVGNDILMPS